jgi:uridylate kinase
MGGSIVNHTAGVVNVEFLKQFRDLIMKYVKKENKFIIIIGGGKNARAYQDFAQDLAHISKENLDWIGIMATRLNAELLRVIFDVKHNVIYNPTEKIDFGSDTVLIGAGWKPGWSTDFDAVKLAINTGAKFVVNVSNTKYVYDKDPRKFKDAKPIKETTWKEFRKIVGEEWKPGLNAPFDPIAAKEAESGKISVFCVSEDLVNLNDVFSGKEFIGTKIN